MKTQHQFPIFQAFWRGLNAKDKVAFAKRCGTNVAYMKQISGGHSKPSAKLAKTIDEQSEGKAPRVEFCPEVFS